MTQLTGKPSAPFERTENFGLETTLRAYIFSVFVHEGHGNTYEMNRYAYLHATHKYKQKQPVTDILVLSTQNAIFYTCLF